MLSVCIGYYGTEQNNRAALLEKTISTINNSEAKDVEIIIVDDYSPSPIPNLICKYPIITHRFEKKQWVNPCIAYNMALSLSGGDKIIIQNAECYHRGDVLSFFDKKIVPNKWLSLSCLAEGYPETWYNHPIYKPLGYHFCAGIHRDNLIYFDEAYKDGSGYDDDDYLEQLKHNGVEISIVPPKEVSVYHQWHPFGFAGIETNEKLFNEKWKKWKK